MADNSTFITGIGGGVLAGALSELPDWATENTLKSISKTLDKHTGIQEGMLKALLNGRSGGVRPDEFARELDRSTRNMRESSRHYPVERQHHEYMSKWYRRAEHIYRFQTDSAYNLAVKMRAIDNAFDKMKEVMSENYHAYDNIYKSGVAVTDSTDGAASGFDSLRLMVARTGLGLESLQHVFKEHDSVAAFGANKFTKALAANKKALIEFGFNTNEAADLQGTYADSLMGMGALQSKTTADIAKETVEYGEALSKLSLRTGLSIKQLQAQTIAMAASTEANLLAADKGADAGMKAAAFGASFKDQNLGKDFLAMMSSKIPALNKTYQSLIQGGLGGFGEKLMSFNKSIIGMDPGDATIAKKNFLNSLTDLDAMIGQQQILAEAGSAAAEANLKTLIAQKQERDRLNNIKDEEIRTAQQSEKSIKAFQSAWESFKANLSKIFMMFEWVLDIATAGLTMVNSVVDSLSETKHLGTAVSVLVSGIVTAGAAFVAFTGLMGALALFRGGRGIMGGVAGAIGRHAGTGGITGAANGAAGAAGRATAGAGRSVGGIFSGLGRGLGGFLKSIAKGVAAFGNPKTIAGALVMVGLGYSIKLLAAGLTDLNKVTGKDLMVGVGAMIAFGAAAAIFGAGIELIAPGALAIGLLGAGLWVFGKAMGAISDSVKTFAEGMQTGATAVNALAPALSTLSASLVGFTGLGVLKDIVGTINDLSIMKVSALAALGRQVSIVTAPAGTSAAPSPTSVTSNAAISPSAPSQNTSTTPNAAVVQQVSSTDINTALAYQATLLEQMNDMMKSLVSVNKDILKYTQIQ